MHNCMKVSQNSWKYVKVPESTKNTCKYAKVHEIIQKYLNVRKSTWKYKKIPKSMQKVNKNKQL